MKWNDITLRQFNDLQEAIKIEDAEERGYEIMRAIFSDSVFNLSIQEFVAKQKELDFLKTEIPKNRVPSNYVVNGHKYKIDKDMGHFTASQYIDYMNLIKTEEMNKYLAVFFIPEEHKYNDGGYDLQTVMDDLLNVDIVTINSLAFFFNRQLQLFIEIFQRSLTRKMKKMKIPKEQKDQLMKIIQNSSNLVSSLIS